MRNGFVEVLSPSSKLPVEITWRGDGAYFAIGWTDLRGTGVRRLYIFDADGALHSVGTDTIGLETGLCWRLKVQLIAISKRCVGSLQMAFYELNGLQHGKVDLLSYPDCDVFRVGKTAFDVAEHIMAVLFLPLDSVSNTDLPFVRLYTTSNYHWSVKAELSLLPRPHPPPSAPVERVSLIFSNAGEIGTVTLYTAVSHGIGVKGSCLSSWSFASCIDRNVWHIGAEDSAIVAVIDNYSELIKKAWNNAKLFYFNFLEGNVGLTAFAHTTIPPPMCATRLIFPSAVGAVSLSPSWPNEAGVTLLVQPANSAAAPWLLALVSDWRGPQCLTSADLKVVQKRQQAAHSGAPSFNNAWALRKDAVAYANENASSIFRGQLLHVTWISPKKFCFVSQDGRHLGMLSQLILNESVTFEVWCLASLAGTTSAVINGLVYGLGGELAVQVGDGGIHFVKLENLEDGARRGSTTVYEFPDVTSTTLPFACDQLYVVTFSCQDQPLHRTYLMGLQSRSYQLCALPWSTSVTRATVTGECVMRSCSSLVLHSDFLLVTSLENQLFTVPLSLESTEFHSVLESLKKRLGSNSVGLRPLESGARLVTAVARGSKVVLQMPRGNLEEIHPRSLVFKCLAPIFDSSHHADAIETMRRHRINFNLLHDYDPHKFLSNVATFVHQVASPEHITLLVSDLNEEDITRTEYSKFFGSKQPFGQTVLAQSASQVSNYLSRTPVIDPYSSRKVNNVCEALLKAMLPEPEKFILPILACYVKMRPQMVEKGLAILKDFKDKGNVDVWEQGLRQLQYYVSPVNLFHTALGTYDLDLAEVMAERTQLDPKEYQPCLQQLRALCTHGGDDDIANTSFQHAQIDILLHRYSRALQGFHSAGGNKLEYRQAVRFVFCEYQEISRLWAEELVASQRLVTAGEVHLRAKHFASAAHLFLSTNSSYRWRVAVACAASASTTGEEEGEALSVEDVRSQASRLANNLTSLGRFEEAMSIYSECLHDYESAVSVAVRGGLWLEARRLAQLAADTGSMLALLKKSALEAYENVAARLDIEAEDFRTTFQRLLEVRAEQNARMLNSTFRTADENFDNVESELFSDTGSVISVTSAGSHASSFSKASGRSQKNRRKRVRKKWSTKRGSKFEEVALIQVLHTTITSCQRLFGGTMPNLIYISFNLCFFHLETIGALIEELWRCGESVAIAKLVRQANGLLTDHRAALNIVWCGEITGATVHGSGEEGDIESARRYPFHEAFLLFPPVMSIQQIDSDFL
ncbi:unnamed protein product [Hydatigera taeniaeformis]|uniref:Elongator complex protein 1 n=1 Tax=Hydatigena taeniaeformis TaxID=6205 RepID=A0A158RDL9_HYDTA|nr:unnamed protein product [Hydatigera taeniaeformis]